MQKKKSGRYQEKTKRQSKLTNEILVSMVEQYDPHRSTVVLVDDACAHVDVLFPCKSRARSDSPIGA